MSCPCWHWWIYPRWVRRRVHALARWYDWHDRKHEWQRQIDQLSKDITKRR